MDDLENILKKLPEERKKQLAKQLYQPIGRAYQRKRENNVKAE
ncbi:hypothetical protein ACFL2Q_14710 [Thermodesulfobacteriota bacterium]